MVVGRRVMPEVRKAFAYRATGDTQAAEEKMTMRLLAEEAR